MRRQKQLEYENAKLRFNRCPSCRVPRLSPPAETWTRDFHPETVAFVRASGVFNCFKITEGDWRNRNKWDAYERAVCNMVDRTSTEIAPWTLVEANDKSFARVKVLKTLCERIGKAL